MSDRSKVTGKWHRPRRAGASRVAASTELAEGARSRRRDRSQRIAFDGAGAESRLVVPSLLTSRDDKGVRRGPYEDAYEVWTGYAAE